MSKCSKINCRQPAEFECPCRNESKLFCNADLLIHLKDTTVAHTPQTLVIGFDSNVKKIAITGLKKCITEIISQKKQILKDLSTTLSLLEQRGKRVICDLQQQKKQLQDIIKLMINSPQDLPESNLKNTLKLSLDKAKEEIAQWKFTSLTLNSNDLKASINNWAIVQNKFNTLLSISQPAASTNYPTYVHRPSHSQSMDAPPQSPRRSQDPPPQNLRHSQSLRTLSCQRNHTLEWSTTVSFKYFRIAKNFWITCDNCKREYTTSGWHCKDCNYDICEGCGLNLGMTSPKLKCSNNHELLWRPDSDAHYQSRGQGHNFKCKECNMIKDEPHWNCRGCDFDVCQSCGSTNHNQSALTGKVACKNGHPIQKLQIRSAQMGSLRITIKCNCCQNVFDGDAYGCQACNYYLCASCNAFYNSPAAGHPALRCQGSHLLRWMAVEKFQCDYCFNTLTEEHYKCKECKFDVCDQCANVMLNIFIKPDIKTHGENRHPLSWTPSVATARNNGNPVPCNLCGVAFKNGGMFCCSSCPTNICLLCYNNPQRPKPQLRNQAPGMNPLNDLIALNLLQNLLRPN